MIYGIKCKSCPNEIEVTAECEVAAETEARLQGWNVDRIGRKSEHQCPACIEWFHVNKRGD